MKRLFPRILLACALASLAFVCLPVSASQQNDNDSPGAAMLPSSAKNGVLRMLGMMTTFNITGNVKADGANLSGATVSLTGAQMQTTTTDAAGNYTLTADAGGDYTVSVYKNGFSFNPASQSFTNLQANQTANFQTGALLCAPAPSSLVAWYRGENNANDSSGFGNNALVYGAGYTTGKVAQAFDFSNGNKSVEAPGNPSNRITGQITIAAWIKPTTLNGLQPIVSKGDDSTGGYSYRLHLLNGGAVKFIVTSSGDRETVTASGTVPAGVYSHVAAIFNPATQAINIYVNGAVVASTTSGSAVPSINDSGGEPLMIGAGMDGDVFFSYKQFFAGQVDEAQVYNRALSASEIAAMYNAGSAGVCSNGSVFTGSLQNKLVFRNSGIAVQNLDGTGYTKLTNNATDREPKWSPDGTKIIFSRDVGNYSYQIFRINSDGTNLVQLTNSSNQPLEADWSPYSNKIVYRRNAAWVGGCGTNCTISKTVIATMNIDGSGETILTAINQDTSDYAPEWSKDGRYIIFERTLSNGTNYVHNIFRMNLNGSSLVRLTNNNYSANPTSSPNGDKIAYYSDQSPQGIWVMGIDGSNQTPLATNYNYAKPAWSGDGTKIAYDGNNIYVVNADGTNSRFLASGYEPSFQKQYSYIGGSNISAVPSSNVNLIFVNVTQAGNTVATALTQSQLPALPAGYTLPANAPMYDIRTSAGYSGNITVSFNVPNVSSASVCSRMRSLHYEANGWTTNTNAAPVYNAGTQVCTVSQTVSSLSPFVVALGPAPTYTISGKITVGGNPRSGISVALNTSPVQNTTTDAQGNYSFANLAEGGNYTVTPSSQNYSISPEFLTFTNLSANQTAANFSGVPNCTYSLSPNGVSAPAAASTGSFTMTTLPECLWSAQSNDSWLTATAPNPSLGTQTVQYSVAANAGPQRTGSITVAGQNFLVTQAAAVYSVSGTVIYGTSATQRFVTGVLMSALGSATATDTTISAGTYSIGNLAAGGDYLVTPSKTGDANGISSFDATLVLRCVAAGTSCALTANQRIAADANFNDQLSAFDATLILRFVAAGAASPNTGQVGNWKFLPDKRNYAALAGPRSNENYEAILIGEVNGSWQAPTTPAQADEETSQGEIVSQNAPK